MCGIFGAVGAQLSDESVSAALRSIAHRGPDGSGVWRAPEVVLGHRRLAIIDLTDGGAQPMRSADETVVVVFNGEIYNHHELRRELAALGHTFHSRSDTEVIVEGYRAWGDEVIERLDGMFAIGLWDARRKHLLLARDRTGKKPLFYTVSGVELRFASEIKTLVASGHRAELQPRSLPLLLAFGYSPAPQTLYRGVHQLPPASLLTFDEGDGHRVRRYWRAPFTAPLLDLTLDQAMAQTRRLVEEAVLRRLEAEVPLGAFLSGGIDSSIIVGVMARSLGSRVKTFSIGFAGDPRYDETHYARIAAKAFGSEHVEFTITPASFDLVGALVRMHDGPFGDSSAIPTSIVSELTRKHVTVALTGDGGDELFCGYIRFLAAEASERMPSAFRHLANVLSRVLPSHEAERNLLTRSKRFFDAAARPFVPRLARLNSLFAFDLQRLLTRECADRLDLDEPVSWTAQILAGTESALPLQRILLHNFETYLPYDLLVKADRSSMMHSLELRSPFLDTRLVEFAARLKPSMKRRGLDTKRILKLAFADLLPPEILHRGKMGFGVPLGAWFRSELRDYMQDHLAGNAVMFDYLDRKTVRGYWEEHQDGRTDHGHRLWLLLTLEVWLRSLRRVA